MTDQTNRETLCQEVEERMAEILDGSASESLFDHISECDNCRDIRYDAERYADWIAAAGADYAVPADLEARLLDELARRAPDAPKHSLAADDDAAKAMPVTTSDHNGIPEPERPRTLSEPACGDTLRNADTTEPGSQSAAANTADLEGVRERTEQMPEAPVPEAAPREPLAERPRLPKLISKRWKRAAVVGAGGFSLAAAAAVVLWLRAGDMLRSGPDANAWRGTAEYVASARGNADGLKLCNAKGNDCQPLAAKGEVTPGSMLRTDSSTRASVKLSDGTLLSLDRSTQLYLEPDSARQATLRSGGLVADVAHLEDHPARFDLPNGHVKVLGTKFALQVSEDSATVDVTRGVVKLTDAKDRTVTVRAGEEGRVVAQMPPFVSTAPALGKAVAWSEAANGEVEDEVTTRGLGELKAKKPGEKTERDGAVTLTAHSVKVRIVGAMARTEIEETFQNQTNDVLEGIYRFPIPPDAKIERLALDVDGKLEEAAFVDRDRAAAIWRGAIVNAKPALRREIREEIVWVPGPWRDPALLEWQRGGRFELRIYPIPK